MSIYGFRRGASKLWTPYAFCVSSAAVVPCLCRHGLVNDHFFWTTLHALQESPGRLPVSVEEACLASFGKGFIVFGQLEVNRSSGLNPKHKKSMRSLSCNEEEAISKRMQRMRYIIEVHSL